MLRLTLNIVIQSENMSGITINSQTILAFNKQNIKTEVSNCAFFNSLNTFPVILAAVERAQTSTNMQRLTSDWHFNFSDAKHKSSPEGDKPYFCGSLLKGPTPLTNKKIRHEDTERNSTHQTFPRASSQHAHTQPQTLTSHSVSLRRNTNQKKKNHLSNLDQRSVWLRRRHPVKSRNQSGVLASGVIFASSWLINILVFKDTQLYSIWRALARGYMCLTVASSMTAAITAEKKVLFNAWKFKNSKTISQFFQNWPPVLDWNDTSEVDSSLVILSDIHEVPSPH